MKSKIMSKALREAPPHLIELWKNDCEHCEETKPILDELEKAGYKIERYNVDEDEGRKVWNQHIDLINKHNMSQGYDVNFIYTPTLFNPLTGKDWEYADKSPTKDEILELFN